MLNKNIKSDLRFAAAKRLPICLMVAALVVLPVSAGVGPLGYLAAIGPAPLRFLTPPTPPAMTFVPTTAPPAPAPEPPKPVVKPVATTNAPVTTAPVDPAATVTQVNSAAPEAPRPDEVVSPQMLLKYFNKSTNGASSTVILPLDFTPPRPIEPPPSKATYSIGP